MLTLNGLRHEFAGRTLFDSIDLTLQNSKYGLIGPNGVGKSTLARILARQLEPTAGHVISSLPPIYLAQSALRDSGTVDDISDEIWSNAPELASLVGSLLAPLAGDKHLQSLSGGEWMRLRLAMVLSQGPGFLILDEPTNDLDREGREIVRSFVQEISWPLLIITHDRELLAEVDEILELSNRSLSRYGVGYEDYVDLSQHERSRLEEAAEKAKSHARRREREREEKLDAQVKRMRDGKKRAPKLGLPRIVLGIMKRNAQKSLAKIKTREDSRTESAMREREQAIEMVKVNPFIRLDFEGAAVKANQLILHLDGVNMRYLAAATASSDQRSDEASNQHWLWSSDLTLTLRGPERIHLKGTNGSGKSSLLRLLLSPFPSLATSLATSPEGRIETKGVVSRHWKSVAYLDQDASSLETGRSVLESVSKTSRFSVTELRNELAFFGFRGESVHQNVETLSGGERLKAALAQIFLARSIPDLLVLDEPTNNLDFGSLETLENALINYRGALILVSHDATFVRSLNTTKTLDLNLGQ